MTTLTPMPAASFDAFADEAIAIYADANAQSGRWPFEGARARARAEFERLLPQGLDTPGHFIYEIQDETLGQAVGSVWFSVPGADDLRSGYVYAVQVAPEFRGRGHAKAAIDLIGSVAADMGLRSLGLHVFSFNTSALALYRSCGYGISGMNMIKPIRRDGD